MIIEHKRKASRKELIERIEELEKEIEDWKFTSKYVEDNYISKDKIGKIIYSNNDDLEIILKIKKLLEEK